MERPSVSSRGRPGFQRGREARHSHSMRRKSETLPYAGCGRCPGARPTRSQDQEWAPCNVAELRKGVGFSTTFWGGSSDGTQAWLIGPIVARHGDIPPKLIKCPDPPPPAPGPIRYAIWGRCRLSHCAPPGNPSAVFAHMCSRNFAGQRRGPQSLGAHVGPGNRRVHRGFGSAEASAPHPRHASQF